MLPALFLLDSGHLSFESPHAPRETRVFSADDRARLCGWAADYQAALRLPEPRAKLFAIGQALYSWLEGGQGWLGGLLQRHSRHASASPLLVEFAVSFLPPPSDPASSGSASASGSGPEPLRYPDAALEAFAFLEAPWELLADSDGHLAVARGLCPLRRVGRASAPPEPPPEARRLQLAFMAAQPRDGGSPLGFEEEEVAILRAVESLALDLVVEESGDPELLARRLSKQPADVLHLSCHGSNLPPQLALENEIGERRPVGPAELNQKLGDEPPRLLFLSACLSAEGDGRQPSFALQLLHFGLHAVLGWSGSVRDREATRFAAAFYAALSRREPLELAFAAARAALCGSAPLGSADSLGPALEANAPPAEREAQPSRDWHLARLYLGRLGGGRFCGTQLPPRPPAPLACYLDPARRRSPVAGPETFVGRRRLLQAALRGFLQRGHVGVLLHGLGRQGKSSLAFRIAQRCPDYQPVLIYGEKDGENQPLEPEAYGAAAILSQFLAQWRAARKPSAGQASEEGPRAWPALPPAFLAALATQLRQAQFEGEAGPQSWGDSQPGAALEAEQQGALLRQAEALLEHQPQRLGALLAPLVAEGRWLLILDDLEQILEAKPGGGKHHRLKPAWRPVLLELIKLAELKRERLRLLITSRYGFELYDEGNQDRAAQLQELALAPMAEPDSRKQLRAQRLARGLAAEADNQAASERESRCIAAGRGNPGLQDLLTRLALESGAACDRALAQIESHLATGADPEEAELQAFLSGLALESLLALLSKSERELLRISTLIEVPVPPEIYVGHADARAGLRLQGLGLWDRHEDLCDHRRIAVAPNPLVRPRLESLSPEERKALAAQLAEVLEREWGGPERVNYPEPAQLALLELALAGQVAELVARTAWGALVYLDRSFERRRAGQLAEKAVGICEDAGVAMPARLMYRASQALGEVGSNLPLAWRLAERALAVYELSEREGGALDRNAFAYALAVHGDHLQTQGEWERALACFERAAALAAQEGHQRNQAVCLGKCADILVSRGELEQALRIREEQELPVFQRLGDVRSIAVTMGKIADILASRGELEQALRIRKEQELPVYQRLGEVRLIALTMGQIADILVSRGELEQALRIRQEQELPVYQRLGDVRSIAVTMGKIAQIFMSWGRLSEARQMREECLKIHQDLGDQQEIAACLWDLAKLDLMEEQYQSAIQQMGEAYALFLKLGGAEGLAVVGKVFGQILCQSGLTSEGLAILERSRDAFQRLGRPAKADAVAALIAQFRASS